MVRGRGRLTHPQRELWLRVRQFATVNARRLAAFAAAEAMLVASLALVLDGYLLGLVQGLAISGLVGMLWVLFLMSDARGQAHLKGCWGESSTRDVLAAARRAGDVEGWVDNVETAGGDVDHLVVTAGGVLAIDSKWRGRQLSPHMLEADVRSAACAAGRATSVLRSLQRPPDVIPVLVVWGGGRELLRWGRRINGVHVVAGPHLRGWLREHARRSALSVEDGESLLHELRGFRDRVRPPRHDDPARVA